MAAPLSWRERIFGKRDPGEVQALLAEKAVQRRESARRWYAYLPVAVLVWMCVAVAVLVGLLSAAPQGRQRSPAASAPSAGPASAPSAVASAPAPVASAASAPPARVGRSIGASELFAFGSGELRRGAGAVLGELDACAAQEVVRVAIVGHADCIGDSIANRRLSLRRAGAVRDYLVGRGVDAQRMTATGRGDDEARADPMCAAVLRDDAATRSRLGRFRRVDVSCEQAPQA